VFIVSIVVAEDAILSIGVNTISPFRKAIVYALCKLSFTIELVAISSAVANISATLGLFADKEAEAV